MKIGTLHIMTRILLHHDNQWSILIFQSQDFNPLRKESNLVIQAACPNTK